MKKTIAAALCVALATVLLIGHAAAAENTGYRLAAADSFTLSADEVYTNTVQTGNKQAIDALRELLSSAGKLVARPESADEIARIEVEASAKTRSYLLLRDGEAFYLARGSQCRPVGYAQIEEFLYALPANARFYKYGNDVPSASFEVGGSKYGLAIHKHTYSYRALSGKFLELAVDYDMEAPHVALGNAGLPALTFTREPKNVYYTVRAHSNTAVVLGTNVAASGTAEQVADFRFEESIQYRVDVEVEYDHQYYGGLVHYYYYVNEEPEFEVTVDGGNTHLGEVVVIRVRGSVAAAEPATVTSDLAFSTEPAFFRQADGSQVCLFPLSYLGKVGEHRITVSCAGRSEDYRITANDKTWQIQNLTVSEATTSETIESRQANEEYERVIAPLRPVADSERHWSGRFILPVSDQKVTTQFGMVRYVNGEPTSTRHGALDLAVPRGTAVKATGTGRVLYAGYLQLTGNTVLIEHGYGLKSWYYHMDSLSVKTGDRAQQGQVIGTVGSTGFSTGPHLHFGMSVNNIFINPYTAINTDLLALP